MSMKWIPACAGMTIKVPVNYYFLVIPAQAGIHFTMLFLRNDIKNNKSGFLTTKNIHLKNFHTALHHYSLAQARFRRSLIASPIP